MLNINFSSSKLYISRQIHLQVTVQKETIHFTLLAEPLLSVHLFSCFGSVVPQSYITSTLTKLELILWGICTQLWNRRHTFLSGPRLESGPSEKSNFRTFNLYLFFSLKMCFWQIRGCWQYDNRFSKLQPKDTQIRQFCSEIF